MAPEEARGDRHPSGQERPAEVRQVDKSVSTASGRIEMGRLADEPQT